MNPFAKHAASLADLQTYYGDGLSNCTWNQIDFPCFASSTRLGKDLGLAGYSIDADLHLVILDQDLAGATPVAQQKVVYPVGGTTYRIITVIQPPGALQTHLLCENDSRGT